MTGYSRIASVGQFDIILIKTDNSGDSLWSNTFGGSSWEAANSVTETSDGGFLVCGHTNSFSTSGDADLWLIKTDANGDSMWDVLYGGSGDEIGYHVSEMDDNGFIISGFTSSYGNGDNDVLLLRTDASGITSIKQTDSAPIADFVLEQNYPNPFNPTTKINYTLAAAGVAVLNVYDISGRLISTLADGVQSAGTHSAVFDGTGLASGVYYYRLQANKHTATKKLILMR